ncbi:MAG: hypothetical protein ACR2NJ_07040, partial [Acidimicrobiales bacterium]
GGRIILYLLCAIVTLFCVVALGWGPWLFAGLGAAAFFAFFAARRRRWWGLPAAAAGLALALGALAGWPWKTVLAVLAAAFVVGSAVRMLARTSVSTPPGR